MIVLFDWVNIYTDARRLELQEVLAHAKQIETKAEEVKLLRVFVHARGLHSGAVSAPGFFQALLWICK